MNDLAQTFWCLEEMARRVSATLALCVNVVDSSLGNVAQAGKLEEHLRDWLLYLNESQSAVHLNASMYDWVRAVGVELFGEPPGASPSTLISTTQLIVFELRAT